MQFLICEGCDLREKPCVVVDQGLGIDQTGYPSNCLYDKDGTVFGNKKWNRVDAADIALGMFSQALEIIFGKAKPRVEAAKLLNVCVCEKPEIIVKHEFSFCKKCGGTC